MRFFNKYAYMGAIALVGAVGFTACSSEDDLTAQQNPTFDGESVKTQFAISIPYAGKGTRLAEDIVQGQTPPTFRGMSNIKLIPFSAEPATGTLFTSDAIVLDDITNGTGGLNDLKGGAKFYSDISVPVGTNHFLFYSEATRSGDISDKANGSISAQKDFTDGDLLNGLTSLDNLKFTLTDIHVADLEIQDYLLTILNTVTASLSSQATSNATLELALTNLKNLKVGSSNAILAIMQDLYDIVKTGGTAENSTVANAITANTTNFFTESGGTLSYNTTAPNYVTDANNYPGCLGIPDGAAQVEYQTSTTAKFVYISDKSSDFTTYTYPAALYYFVNSTVGASDQTHGESWSGSSSADWDTFVGNSNYPNDVVSASTQSIVLKNPIQYAVSQLVYNVKFASNSGELKDNQGINRAIGTDNFKLKGILIGGQKGVDYKFEQDANAAAKTIYDPLTTETAITTSSNNINFYSLALQTAKRESQAGSQESVNIALEFINNGEDFYGIDGIVPAGGTFYLAGTLSTKTTDADNDYVFEQDHKTIANITINSLENAQYTIPDLRKTELELGLYVDLDWKEGLVYDVTIQ